MFWTAQEDIYSPINPVLLLKAGQPVPTQTVTRLVEMGFKANLFEPLNDGMTNPITTPSGGLTLIVETDPKAIKRLLSFFEARYERAHVVALPQNLLWAVNKYTPSRLILDLNLALKTPGLSTLIKLSRHHQIILTQDHDTPWRQLEQVREAGLSIIQKPVNRLRLRQLIQPQDRQRA
jgi:hypothetical protein